MIGYGSEKKKHETKSRTNFNLVLVYKVREYVVCTRVDERKQKPSSKPKVTQTNCTEDKKLVKME